MSGIQYPCDLLEYRPSSYNASLNICQCIDIYQFQMRTCQYLTQDDEEELLHTDYEEFCCQVPGCKATFNQLIDSEFHYASKHTFACSVCRKSLPSFHLLSLHIAENHDSFFNVLSNKKPSFECLLETCANSSGAPKVGNSPI